MPLPSDLKPPYVCTILEIHRTYQQSFSKKKKYNNLLQFRWKTKLECTTKFSDRREATLRIRKISKNQNKTIKQQINTYIEFPNYFLPNFHRSRLIICTIRTRDQLPEIIITRKPTFQIKFTNRRIIQRSRNYINHSIGKP
jgi:hypothetical protein